MENEVLLAIGTAYVQGEDVAARGRVLLYSIGKNTENPDNLVFMWLKLNHIIYLVYH